MVGLVSAGITVDTISAAAAEAVRAAARRRGRRRSRSAALGTYVINARLRRHTHGMNAAELSRMHDYHQAALHAVREGLLMLDGQQRVALINDGGPRTARPATSDAGRPLVAELGLPRAADRARCSPPSPAWTRSI